MEHQGAELLRLSMVTCDPSCHPQLASLVKMDSHDGYIAPFFFHFFIFFIFSQLFTNSS